MRNGYIFLGVGYKRWND